MTPSQQSHTKEEILQYLLKQGPATAQNLAVAFDLSPQAIRRHLKDLEGEDLIQYQVVHAGVGRPQHVYELSRQGRSHFPASYDEFAVSLLDTLATVAPEQFGAILRQQWERKATDYRHRMGSGSLPRRLDRLVDLRRREGYMAEWYPAETEETEAVQGYRYIFTEYNCAIATVAESFPTVCDHELKLFAMALPDCSVERTHWLRDGQHHCGYLIQKKD